MPIPTLVGSAEAAKLLEIGPTNFSHLRSKMRAAGDDSFPEPVTQLQCGPIWTEKDMLKFKKHYDSRRRRTRSTNGDAAVEAKAPAKTVAKAPAKPRARKTAAPEATVTDISPKTSRKLKVKAPA